MFYKWNFKKRIYSSLFILILPLFSLVSYSQTEINRKYLNPTPGEISIIASTPIPDTQPATHEAYQELAECGFNGALVTGGIDFIQKQFDLCGELELKFMVRNDYLYNENADKLVNALKNDVHLGGWNFSDEPPFSRLEPLSKAYNRLREIDPDHLIWMNLIGGLNKNSTGDLKNYREYLNYIKKLFNPEVWSFDVYPIYVQGNKVNVMYDTFFSDLEMYREISNKSGMPFWSYCQGMQHTTGSLVRPAPTEEFLSFQIFSALAYGAQGIVYWTYGQRKSNSYETYYSALVNIDGKRSPAWYAAQKVNNKIKKFKDIFLGCKVQTVSHTGDHVYRDTRKLSGGFGPFSKVTTASSGALFSLIKNNNKEYVVIVSHDVINSQKISLFLKNNKNVKELTELSAMNNNTRKIDFVLPKGGVAIFQVL